MVALLKSSPMLEGSDSSLDDVSEGARRASVETSSGASPPDPEVEPIARRRRFSGSEKRRLLAEAERCKAKGQLGAFLRREGLYSSMLANWKKQVGKAELAALAPKKRGPKANPGARQIQQLNRDNARLRRELDRAKLIIDARKNCAWRWVCRPRTRRARTSDGSGPPGMLRPLRPIRITSLRGILSR